MATGMPESFESVVKTELRDIKAELQKLGGTVGDLSEDLHGIPTRGYKGIRERLETVERLTDAMAKEREAINNKLRGILIGLGLTGVTTGGLLAAVIRLVTGHGP